MNQPSADNAGARSPRGLAAVGSRFFAIAARLIEGPGPASLAHNFAADDVERIGWRLQQLGRHIERFFRTFIAAICVADAVIAVAREACAPMPNAMRSVWPWMTRQFL